MFDIILTIICSSSIALILKQNSLKSGSSIVLLASNYFSAAVISLLLSYNELESVANIWFYLFGIVLGGLFVISFFIFSKAVSNAGTGLATTSSRLSVVVPVLLSILFLDEEPGIFQALGLGLTLITIILFYFSLRNTGIKKDGSRAYIYLLGVLLGIGIADFSMKLFESYFGDANKSLFLLMVFGSAFVYSTSISIYRKRKPERKTVLLGLLLGVPNIFSSYFLINALSEIEAVVVFPLVNIGIILLTTLTALIIWKEKVNREGMIALLAGVTAIIFLSF